MGKFANNYQSGFKNAKQRSHAAFTLVEMLAVMGIIATMLGMVLPAINDVLGSKGRKGAVNILLNTFEQARVAALEQSTNVYVGFADGNIPDNAIGGRNQGFAYTRFIVFREYNAELDPAYTAPAIAPKFVTLTKWLALPKGICFKSGNHINDSANSSSSPGPVAAESLQITPADNFPNLPSGYAKMPIIKFSNTGIIQAPTVANPSLYIYEGFYATDLKHDVFVRAKGQGENNGTPYGLFERITFARYTGRAQLDVTSI